MKKLITILLFIPILAKAQIDEKHFIAGSIASGIANIETYEIIKDTQIPPFWAKAISFAVGVGVGTLAGHAKEKWDEKQVRGMYSRKDFNSTVWGSLAGSFTVRLVMWNSVPESHVPLEELWLIDEEFVKR